MAGSVALGHPTRVTESQLQDLFLVYCNERAVKVVSGMTDNLYSERLGTRGHLDTIAVEGFVRMISAMHGVIDGKTLRPENVKWAFMSKLPPSLPSPNAAAWKKPKRVYELTWPLFLGALAEVAVLKTRDLDLERSHAFEIFLDDHVGPLFERRFREASGSDGEAAAMGLQTELGASTAYGGDGVLSRGVVSGVASVRARASRCVITSSNGVMPLVEARDAGLSYTTLNIHDFEPIAGAGLSTRLAVSMALPVAAVGAAGGGAQLFGVHSKGDGLFRRSTPRENGSIDYGGNVLSPNGSSASSIGGWEGVGTYAGADAFGKGPKAGAGLVRGDRYALAILRGDDSHSSTSSVHGDSWPSPSFTDQRSTVFRHLNRDRDRSQNMPTSPFSTSAFRE